MGREHEQILAGTRARARGRRVLRQVRISPWVGNGLRRLSGGHGCGGSRFRDGRKSYSDHARRRRRRRRSRSGGGHNGRGGSRFGRTSQARRKICPRGNQSEPASLRRRGGRELRVGLPRGKGDGLHRQRSPCPRRRQRCHRDDRSRRRRVEPAAHRQDHGRGVQKHALLSRPRGRGRVHPRNGEQLGSGVF